LNASTAFSATDCEDFNRDSYKKPIDKILRCAQNDKKESIEVTCYRKIAGNGTPRGASTTILSRGRPIRFYRENLPRPTERTKCR